MASTGVWMTAKSPQTAMPVQTSSTSHLLRILYSMILAIIGGSHLHVAGAGGVTMVMVVLFAHPRASNLRGVQPILGVDQKGADGHHRLSLLQPAQHGVEVACGQPDLHR